MSLKVVIHVAIFLISSVSCEDFLESILNDCYDEKCINTRISKKIDEVYSQPKLEILGNAVYLEKIDDDNNGNEGRASTSIVEKLSDFLSHLAFKVNLPESVKQVRKLITEGKSSKFKKFLIPFVVLMVLKKSIEVPISLAIVTLVAFKGLGAGLVALMLSAATAFKTLLEHNSSSKVSYEVVPQLAPHWSRSGEDYNNFYTLT